MTAPDEWSSTDVTTSADQPAAVRVLVVADWALDPYGVMAACRRRAAAEPQVTFALVVPAWLHGLDWAGDPYASRPRAARQLETLERLASRAGLEVAAAEVGDPDPTSAIEDVHAELYRERDHALHPAASSAPPVRPG